MKMKSANELHEISKKQAPIIVNKVLDGVNMDNIKPIPINTWMEIRERYEDLEKKFVRVKKLGGN